jgi:hypothetical protein
MKNSYLIIFIATIFSITSVTSQETDEPFLDITNFSDGPYVFISNNKLIEKKILNGKVTSKVLEPTLYDTIFTPQKSIYKNVENIAALSDIHGQYDLAIEILKNNGIINSNLDWNFGKGHLVIVGDVFDRGPKINEMLWLLYKLEIQAKEKGGRLHFLLGNHEYMVLHKDLRYVHDRYKIATKLLGLEYDELYSNQTIIGRWLRSKSTIIKINNSIFVHGGVSEEFIAENGIDLSKTNQIMRSSIERSKQEMKSTDFYKTYYGKKSLIWYRGYFYDNLVDADITKILTRVNSGHIIVGHCSNEEVVQLYDHKIFGVDSSIKKGTYGELLFIKNNQFYRGTLDGKLVKF